MNNFFRDFNLSPANLDESAVGPITTFKGGMGISTIDYIAITEGLRKYLKECQVLKDDICNTSDHYAVRAVLSLQCCPKLCSISQTKGCVKWAKPNVITRYQGLVSEEICNITANFDANNPSPETVDALVDDLVKCLVNASDKLPRSKFRKNVRPFWNANLTTLKKSKVDHYRRWKDAGKPLDQATSST